MRTSTIARLSVTIAAVTAAIVMASSVAATIEGTAPGPPKLKIGSFTAGGGVATGNGVTLGASIGDAFIGDTEGPSALGAGSPFAVNLAGDACPTIEGTTDYDGCPVAVDVTTVLKVIDQRPRAECRSCVEIPESRVKVFDRNKLDGVVLDAGTPAATVLSKNPDPSLYDDIYESDLDDVEAAMAGDFGCVSNADGSCVAGIDATGDLLVITRFDDTTDPLDGDPPTVYAGRSLTTGNFVDTDSDGDADLVAEQLQIQKTIDKRGKVTYVGAKSVGLVVIA